MRRNVLAPLDDNQGTRRYVPAHRGKDPRGFRRNSQGGNRTHGPNARWEELRGGKSFAAKLYAKGDAHAVAFKFLLDVRRPERL